MGTVYKETFTKPLPAGAKIIVRKGQRFAEWIEALRSTRGLRNDDVTLMTILLGTDRPQSACPTGEQVL